MMTTSVVFATKRKVLKREEMTLEILTILGGHEKPCLHGHQGWFERPPCHHGHLLGQLGEPAQNGL